MTLVGHRQPESGAHVTPLPGPRNESGGHTPRRFCRWAGWGFPGLFSWLFLQELIFGGQTSLWALKGGRVLACQPRGVRRAASPRSAVPSGRKERLLARVTDSEVTTHSRPHCCLLQPQRGLRGQIKEEGFVFVWFCMGRAQGMGTKEVASRGTQ